MKIKISVILLFLSFLYSFIPLAYAKTSGYLSFGYVKGEKESEFYYGTFHNPSVGLMFFDEIVAKVNFFAELRFQEGDTFELDQAWVGINPSESFNLRFGLYLVPFGKYNESSRPHETMLITVPLNVESLYPRRWRDIGILTQGRWGGLIYSAYIGNGLAESQDLKGGQQFKDNNRDKGKGVRIGWMLQQGFEVGYSHYQGKFDDGNTRKLIMHGFDATWVTTEGFQILAEYANAQIENPEEFSDGKVEGYFVQCSFVIESLRPVLSYQKLKYTDRFHGPGFMGLESSGEGISIDKSRWALGLVFVLSQKLLLKVEYDWNKEGEAKLKDNALYLQMAYSF